MKKFIFVLLILLILGLGSSLAEGLSIHYLDVDHGDAIVLQSGGESMLIDGGKTSNSEKLMDYLQNKLGVERLAAVIATHPHDDHVGGLIAVLENIPVERLYCPVTSYEERPFPEFVMMAEAKGLALRFPETGESFLLGEAEVRLFPPQQAHKNANNLSIITRVEYKGKGFLFMGDAKLEAEEDLLASDFVVQASGLKVGHHGYARSTGDALLEAVKPDYAVISVEAGGAYQNTKEKLESLGIAVYVTGEKGDIEVRWDGERMEIETSKE